MHRVACNMYLVQYLPLAIRHLSNAINDTGDDGWLAWVESNLTYFTSSLRTPGIFITISGAESYRSLSLCSLVPSDKKEKKKEKETQKKTSQQKKDK